MTLTELEAIFNRALSQVFSRKKLLVTLAVLFVCGFFSVFCRGVSLYTGTWVGMSLAFLAFFFCSALLLCLGVVLIRVYQGERKYDRLVHGFLELFVATSYVGVPVVAAFLLMWTLVGLFHLISVIPAVGSLVGSILAFAPFLLIFGALLLCVLNLLILFIVAPAIALHPEQKPKVTRLMIRRIASNVFGNIFLGFIALLPLLCVVGLEVLAIRLAAAGPLNTSETVLTWFFVMIPFAALAAPAVVFFFNFAAESHVILTRRPARQEDEI